MELPFKAVRGQVAAALDLIVQISRFADGSRRLVELCEVGGLDAGGDYLLNPLFGFELLGKDPVSGRLAGELKPSGRRPGFLKELELTGVALEEGLFG